MYHLALDTNTWIYLANGTEPVRLLKYIKQEIDKGNIKILLSDVVIKEWNKNKSTISRQGAVKFSKDINEGLGKIKMLLESDNEPDYQTSFIFDDETESSLITEREELLNSIKNFEAKQTRIRKEIDKAIAENIQLIDAIFLHTSTDIIKASHETLEKISDFASSRKAPFVKKHSLSDAIIVLGFLDYVKTNSILNSAFITYNTEDFCEKKNGKNALHSDLVPEFDNAQSNFYTTLSAAINPIMKLITNYELKLIESIKNDLENEIEYCRVCEETNEHSNEIYFEHFKRCLSNERIKSSNIIERQSELNLDIRFTEIKSIEHIQLITVGYCSWCSSEHFKCASCDTVNAVWESEYNERKECDGCGLPYLIERDNYRNSGSESEYTLLADKNKCDKCGSEFEDDGSNTNVCKNCEEFYSYDQ